MCELYSQKWCTCCIWEPMLPPLSFLISDSLIPQRLRRCFKFFLSETLSISEPEHHKRVRKWATGLFGTIRRYHRHIDYSPFVEGTLSDEDLLFGRHNTFEFNGCLFLGDSGCPWSRTYCFFLFLLDWMDLSFYNGLPTKPPVRLEEATLILGTARCTTFQ